MSRTHFVEIEEENGTVTGKDTDKRLFFSAIQPLG